MVACFILFKLFFKTGFQPASHLSKKDIKKLKSDMNNSISIYGTISIHFPAI